MIAAALCLLLLPQVGSSADETFLRDPRLGQASRHHRAALETFLEAEALTLGGEYARAERVLSALWRRYPVGSEAWTQLPSRLEGVFLGTPPCYYALRMLTDIARWRLERGERRRSKGGPVQHLRLTVVLIGEGTGLEPADPGQLARGEGRPVVRELDPRLLADDHALVHESLALFREYVALLTDGRLGLEVDVRVLESLSVPLDVGVRDGRRHAGLADPAPVFAHLPPEVLLATDWWWVLHPTHIPRGAAFAGQEFITGGMGAGPNGSQPLFLIDDLWLVRKPPHLGEGDYSSVERRAYLPQWLQHELFHHLFGLYPRFGLEAQSHQWFDRSTWPADFVGRFEPDYYHEALFRRLRDAEPPLHVTLRHVFRGPDLERLQVRDLVGTYAHEPEENAWHRGELRLDPEGKLRWRNGADVEWSLEPDFANGRLLTGPDCPYHRPGHPSPFVLVPAWDEQDRTTGIAGFRFQGGLYLRR